MNRSEFRINKMDCPSEEQMIRMKLAEMREIRFLDFDIPSRKLVVFHEGDSKDVADRIHSLHLDSSHIATSIYKGKTAVAETDQKQRKLLWWVLIINFSFFILEMVYGILSSSMGLIADSLDMLADSIVYGLSLMVVGSTITRKKKIATLSGYFQILLASLGLIEVVRRFVGQEIMPGFKSMILVSFLALLANSISLYLIQKAKSSEVHMQASAIFTSNDIIINSGVILAGILVYLTASPYPDLVIGAIIFLIVMRGAYRILQLGR